MRRKKRNSSSAFWLMKKIVRDTDSDFAIGDLTANSDYQFDLFVPIEKLNDAGNQDNWGSHWLHSFVLLQENTSITELEQKLSGLIQEKLPEEKIALVLQSLGKIHLYKVDGKMSGMKYVYFFSVIAVFILTIACINFINLSTARYEKKAKEVGLRKVVGANRGQLIKQFFGESIPFTSIALFVCNQFKTGCDFSIEKIIITMVFHPLLPSKQKHLS